MFHASIAVAAFVGAAALIAVRPWGLDEGLSACGLAILEVGFGVLSPAGAVASLRDALPVLVFFAVLLTLVGLLARTSLIDAGMNRLARLSQGSPVRLLGLTLAFAAAVTIVGTNDATALILPVAVAPLIVSNRLPATPYVLGICFVANSASLVLPTSNPATLLALAHLHVSPLVAAGPLAVAGVLATLATAGATLLIGRRSLAGAALAEVVAAGSRQSARAPVPWSLLALVAGFTILVTGLEQSGVTATLARSVRGVSPFEAGVAAGVAANLLNNLPTAIAVGAVVPNRLPHILSVIAGADLGPNLAPLGSLSNLLILAGARRAGIAVGWRRFLLWGLVLGPLSVLVGLAALALLLDAR